MHRAGLTMDAYRERQVLKLAATSRAVVSLIAALTALVVTPYDTSTHLESRSNSLLSAFANWDGVYFAHIARHGYDYEHVHAFFPLYPMLMRALSRVLPLEPSMATIASGWIISLMCFFSFGGMVCLEQHKRSGRFKELLYCALLFGCASATRSNGILLSLFIAWHRLWVSPSPVATPGAFLRFWLLTALLGAMAIGPQIAYFVYGVRVYCPSLSGQTQSYLVEDRSWCAHVIPNFSAMYTFIQKEYWNIGLLNYYEVKQIPNFLLAAPIITLSGHSLFQYFRSYFADRDTRTDQAKKRNLVTSSATPYYVYWLFLLVNALLVMHIQVTTRFLCACPSLFWAPAAASIFETTAGKTGGSSTSTWKGKLVVAYFLLFSTLGAVLFPSFYPWT